MQQSASVIVLYAVRKNRLKSYLHCCASLNITKSKGTKSQSTQKYGCDASFKLNIVQFSHNRGNNWKSADKFGISEKLVVAGTNLTNELSEMPHTKKARSLL